MIENFRCVPPAAGFPSPEAITNAQEIFSQIRSDTGDPALAFRQLLQKEFCRSSVTFTASGTEALTRTIRAACRALSRDTVVVAGYTCPDVAVAAIKAGARVLVADVHPQSLALDCESVPLKEWTRTAALVLSNLYGIPESVEVALRIRDVHGCWLVDDACQAALSYRGARRVGAQPGSIGILSFGRGKAICGVGGGAILHDSELPELMGDSPGEGSIFFEVLKARLFFLLQRPEYYGILAALPGTGIGKTRVKPDRKLGTLDLGKLIVAYAAWQTAISNAASVVKSVTKWSERAQQLGLQLQHESFPPEQLQPLIRFPILLKNAAQKRQALKELRKFGLSPSYPQSLDRYNVLARYCEYSPLARSHVLAERLCTLAVHPMVTEVDHEIVANGLRRILQ